MIDRPNVDYEIEQLEDMCPLARERVLTGDSLRSMYLGDATGREFMCKAEGYQLEHGSGTAPLPCSMDFAKTCETYRTQQIFK